MSGMFSELKKLGSREKPATNSHHSVEEPPTSVAQKKAANGPVPPVRAKEEKPRRKRVMRRRHPLDIYEDQYEFLLEYQKEQRRKERLGSMSEFVRNALDQAIDKYRKK